jgi:hypothetical protein
LNFYLSANHEIKGDNFLIGIQIAFDGGDIEGGKSSRLGGYDYFICSSILKNRIYVLCFTHIDYIKGNG